MKIHEKIMLDCGVAAYVKLKNNYKNSKKSGKETVTTDDKNNVELFLME